MARPGLFTHRKLPRLARLAEVKVAEALGLLEFLWHAQYEACSEVVGDALDVETLARWEGEPGKLAAALAEAGFIDTNESGSFSVHDFWDHAPDYVRKRAEREDERRTLGFGLCRNGLPRSTVLAVFSRYDRCGFCGSTDRLEIDHIIPRAAGGSNETNNLWLLCLKCNRAKGSRLIDEVLSAIAGAEE